MNGKVKRLIVLVVTIISIFLGSMILYYPDINKKTTDFSCDNAKDYLKVIASEPHSTKFHQKELAKVRSYLIDKLEEFNMNPQVFTYEDVSNSKGESADLHNIYGKIDGVNGEDGSYILLVAHYDSAENNHNKKKEGYSCGAADDGYGLAVILETLRNIKNSGRQLENGIKVLFTDGEEMRLIGSHEEFDKNFSLYKNVSYVINCEARGSSGPAIMFQTSDKNSRVLDLYEKADYPITSSLITDIYKNTGRSDFLNIKAKEIPGINFTTLDKVEYYHTHDDTYENIDDKSIKHYGDQVNKIIQEFIFNSKYNDCDYFKKGDESIFFVPFSNVVFKYSVITGQIISVILIIAVIVMLILNGARLKSILIETLKNIIYVICSMLGGLLFSFIMAKIAHIEFNLSCMGKVPGDDIMVIIIPIILFITFIIIEGKKKGNFKCVKERLLSAIMIYTIILILSIIYLPGISYLTMIPLALLFISLGVIRITNNNLVRYTLLLPLVSIVILYVQLILILNMSFSIGALIFTSAIIKVGSILIAPIKDMLCIEV